MLSKSEQSMFDVLHFCKIAELPEKHDGKSVCIKAIAKTKKNDLNSYYCYMERDKIGKPSIVRDFGPCRAIVEIEEYYPLLYLDSVYVKKFPRSNEGTANLIQYLRDNGVAEAEHADDRKELDKMNICLAIQKQLADEKKKSKLIIKD